MPQMYRAALALVILLAGAVGTATADAATNWVPRGTAFNGTAANEAVGLSTALSADGTVLAVGAPQIGSGAGSVRVYDWTGSAWQLRGSAIAGLASNDNAGYAVALSADGDVVAVGAYKSDANGTDSGQVLVYAWNGSAWVQRGLPINGEAANDECSKVALSASGDVIAVGATGNDGAGSLAGHVRVFAWSGSAWQQQGADLDGEAAGDAFGGVVSLASDGTTLAVGAGENDGGGSASGTVRVFTWSGSAWVQRGGDLDGAAGDARGPVAISADGTVLAAGAPRNSDVATVSGKVQVFAWNGSQWVQRGSAMLGESAQSRFGSAVALSRLGNVVAVGAPGYSASTGRVLTYAWDGSAWTQRGVSIDGPAASSSFGTALALTPDGTTLAAGAYGWANGANANAGHARAYTWDGPTDGTDSGGGGGGGGGGDGGGGGGGGGGSGGGGGAGDATGTGSGTGSTAGGTATGAAEAASDDAAASTGKTTAARPRVTASAWVRRAVVLLRRGEPRATLNATLDDVRAGTISRSAARVVIRRDVLAVREAQIADLPGLGQPPRSLRRAERLLRRSLVLSAKADRAYVAWLGGEPDQLARAITMGLLASEAKARLVPLLTGRGVVVPPASDVWP